MKKTIPILLSLVGLLFFGNCQKNETQPGSANEAQAQHQINTSVKKNDPPDNVKDAFKKAGHEIKEFFVGKDTNDVDDDDD